MRLIDFLSGVKVNKDLLIKCLGLLGSDQDGEVLAAARRAHKIVKDAGMTWELVLGGTVKPKAIIAPWNKDFSATPAPPSNESVATATAARVKAIMLNLKGKPLGTKQIIFNQLYRQWEATEYLNSQQRGVLFEIEKIHAQGV
jgi:hypothetical protein